MLSTIRTVLLPCFRATSSRALSSSSRCAAVRRKERKPLSVYRSVVNKNVPLSAQLYDAFALKRPSRAKKEESDSSTKERETRAGPRVDVVGSGLCDDIISYLTPTLEQYKGCDIIDIHPGACLWSQKIHDYLKPRRHLLMEPEERYFEPFIKPLLDQPNSAYRHTLLAGAHPEKYWDNYRHIFAEADLLTPRPALDKDDPRKRQRDPSLLVIGNLARQYKRSIPMRSVHYSSLVLQHFTWAALMNDLFHTNGLVRCLLWMPESEKRLILANNTQATSGFNMGLEVGASLCEVAEVQSVNDSRVTYFVRAPSHERDTALDLAGTRAVAKRMEEAGMKIPEGRETDEYKAAMAAKEEDLPRADLFSNLATSVSDLSQRIKLVEAQIKLTSDKRPRGKRQSTWAIRRADLKDSLPSTFRWPENLQRGNRDIRLFTPALRDWFGPVLDAYLAMISLEGSYSAVASAHPTDPALPALKSEIIALSAEAEDLIDRQNTNARPELYSLAEELQAFSATPPVLSYDRRPYVPLRAQPQDFYPLYNLTLLDLVPKSENMTSDIADAREARTTCYELIKYVSTLRTGSLTQALDRIAPNAAKDLIPMVPAITDARRGGRLSPERMRPRMLTEEMVRGLTEAFLEWPFRPQSWELALGSGEAPAEKEIEGEGVEGAVGAG